MTDLSPLALKKLSGFPGGSDDKESACNSGDPGSIRGLGRSPGEGNGSPIQYSYLDNPMDRGTWRATVHAAAAAAKSLQSCPTLCNPIDGSPPGSPIPGILQARILGWVAISFFRRSSLSRDQT